MTQSVSPGPTEPEGENSSTGHDDGRNPHERTKSGSKNGIPDVEMCLRAMAQLAGLVALGILKPAQANSILAVYREILQHHQKSQTQARGAGLSDGDVLSMARKYSELLNLLEPFLTDEQIAMVMQHDEHGDEDPDE